MKEFVGQVTAIVSTPQQAALISVVGVAGAAASYFFGGWSGMVEVLLWAMGLDFLSGMAASIKEGKGLISKFGFNGIVKKVLIVAAVAFGHRIDLAFEMNYVMNGLLIAFLTNEVISLAENYGRMGLPLSQYLQPFIAILKQKGEKDGK